MKRINLILAMAVLLFATSCEDDENSVPMSELTLKVIMPEMMGKDATADDLTVELTNITNGKIVSGKTNAMGIYTIKTEEGIYSVLVNGEKSYTSEVGNSQFEQQVTVKGLVENVSVSGETSEIKLPLFIAPASGGWVFKELYVTGSKTPEGKSYYKDKYIEIYNNTDDVLYADGICIGESDHNTAFDLNIWEEKRDEYFVTHVIYTIPGNGTDYPVAPGESVILADVAINHTAENPNSIDLSAANFEWYDEHRLDVDVPEVPNLIKHFSYSKSIWTPNNRGFNSYVLFKPESSMADFLSNNMIEKQNNNGSTSIRYQVANSIILDAIEMGTPSDFRSKALCPALDISYINCGDGDDARYGKVVRRKVQTTKNGRIVYMDTNNSAVDFHSTVDPQPGVFE
jgi:hypothetical protein